MIGKVSWEESATIPSLPESEVHVWRIPLVNPGKDLAGCLGDLSAEELERANQFHFKQDQIRYMVSHSHLRRLLASYLGLELDFIQLSLGKYGKPRLGGNLTNVDLHFNMAHSLDIALVSFCRGKSIGVDIEHLRPMPDLEQIAARFFSERENVQLAKLAEEQKLEGFFTCWTCKEAFIKNLGEGLSYPLDQFDVDFNPEKPPRLASIHSDPNEAGQWLLTSFPVADGYLGALAVQDMDLSRVRYFSTPA